MQACAANLHSRACPEQRTCGHSTNERMFSVLLSLLKRHHMYVCVLYSYLLKNRVGVITVSSLCKSTHWHAWDILTSCSVSHVVLFVCGNVHVLVICLTSCIYIPTECSLHCTQLHTYSDLAGFSVQLASFLESRQMHVCVLKLPVTNMWVFVCPCSWQYHVACLLLKSVPFCVCVV